MSYHHLTIDQRSQIYAFLSNGISQKKIAEMIGVSPSTISREIKRNKGKKGYRYKQAEEMAQMRQQEKTRKGKKLDNLPMLDIVLQFLRHGCSPEQIAGRLLQSGICISSQTIYTMIWDDRMAGGELYKLLRRKGKKYNYRGGRKSGRGLIPNRKDIKLRPAVVETKERIGDFEGDTVIGARHQGAILTLVDRHSKFTLIGKLEAKSADSVVDVSTKLLSALPNHKKHTITFDNGMEFAGHEEIAKNNSVSCYFATPYHSWERGLNEHTNGLIREFLPKKTDLRQVTQEKLVEIAEKLNNRPRKVLGYLTPSEVFNGIKRPLKIALRP